MKFNWVKGKDDKYEVENLFVGVGAIMVATIEKAIDACGHVTYVGYSELPSLKELLYDPCKDTLKNKIVGITVEWFNKTN